jgi:predicted DsbA family dithiol-disulfide isomerase
LEQLQRNCDVTVRWHSFQLHPPGSPPIPAAHRARIEASRPLFERQARERYGLEIHAGPFETDSRPALIAEKFAEAQGKEAEFHQAVMAAYWQQARSIDDLRVLQELAEQVGLDTSNFPEILSEPAYEAEVERDLWQAQEYGLDGVPALIFANKYLVMGAQPYNVLKQIVERVQAER